MIDKKINHKENCWLLRVSVRNKSSAPGEREGRFTLTGEMRHYFCNLKQWQGGVFAVGKVGGEKKTKCGHETPGGCCYSVCPWVMDGQKGRKGWVKTAEKWDTSRSVLWVT